MISSSLLIKIFGVAIAGFSVVGVPVIIHKARHTAKETARNELYVKLFNKDVPEQYHAGFAASLLDWKPTETQQKYLLNNWATYINHFSKYDWQWLRDYNDGKWSRNFKNVCYLEISAYGYSNELELELESTWYIPFSQDKLSEQAISTIRSGGKAEPISLGYLNRFEQGLQPKQNLGDFIHKNTNKPEFSDDVAFLKRLYETTMSRIKITSQGVYRPIVGESRDWRWKYSSWECTNYLDF